MIADTELIDGGLKLFGGTLKLFIRENRNVVVIIIFERKYNK